VARFSPISSRASVHLRPFLVAATRGFRRNFDAEFGDLFVILVAGNVASPDVWASLQYAGVHLKTQLFMVLGHEGCGAVQAALAMRF
jgi:Carbonic anhydrase